VPRLSQIKMVKRAHSKKARKIKDPYAIIRERDRGKLFEKKPATLDDDFVPRKVQDMMKFVDGVSDGVQKHKKRRHGLKNGLITSRAFVDPATPVKGMTRPLKPIPLFEQKPGESDNKFLKRVQKMTKARIQQSKFEDKYKVDIMPDPVTGETKLISREDDQNTRRRKKKKPKLGEDGEEIKKPNRKKLAKLKRKQKLEGKMDDFAHLKDSVGFGEVNQRPPDIKAAPRKPPVDANKSKPGRKSLLLKKMFTDAQAGSRPSSAPKSLHQKAALEEERLRAVAAYRRMRQERIEQSAKSRA